MSNEPFYSRGIQILALPFTKHVWQFTLLAVGQDYWTEDDEDHQAYEQITWYVQFLFWQFSYTKELV